MWRVRVLDYEYDQHMKNMSIFRSIEAVLCLLSRLLGMLTYADDNIYNGVVVAQWLGCRTLVRAIGVRYPDTARHRMQN